jgi:hypothetical protein
MENALETHLRLTPIRANAYEDLFGGKPERVFPYHQFAAADAPCLVDVFLYPLEVDGLDCDVFAAVTNGMSDLRMFDKNRPNIFRRRELIQYFRVCTEAYSRRLHDIAWLPHFDEFAIDVYDTISFPEPFERDLQHSFFLRPNCSPHAEFEIEIDSDRMGLLWNIPLTDPELQYKQTCGVNALLDRMDEAKLPWLFDPATRPYLTV